MNPVQINAYCHVMLHVPMGTAYKSFKSLRPTVLSSAFVDRDVFNVLSKED